MTYLSEPNEIQKKRLAALFLGQDVEFMLGVVNHNGFPLEDVPEICFAGRSNVGKSSLINALTNRKGLARASNTPGRTQELNYFSLCDDIRMVDLPGYGFAQAPKAKVDVWNALIRDYLKGRRQLQRIFVLIDSRHGLKKIDEEIFSMLDKAGVSYQIVMTKIDKISNAELTKTLAKTKETAKKFIALHPDIITTSSEKKIGLDQVRHEIASFMPDYVQLGAIEEDDRQD